MPFRLPSAGFGSAKICDCLFADCKEFVVVEKERQIRGRRERGRGGFGFGCAPLCLCDSVVDVSAASTAGHEGHGAGFSLRSLRSFAANSVACNFRIGAVLRAAFHATTFLRLTDAGSETGAPGINSRFEIRRKLEIRNPKPDRLAANSSFELRISFEFPPLLCFGAASRVSSFDL
jgi:hypothetical protein